MRKVLFAAFAATMLWQCNAPPRSASDVRTPVALSDVAGAWDIVSFDGYRPARLDSDGQRHAFVDIRGDDVSFSIECNYSGMKARVAGGRLIATSSDTAQTAMGCGPEREQRDATFFAFLRGGPSIALHSEHDLVLEADGVRLELQRPEVRRRDLLPARFSELEGAWRADIVYWRVEPGRTDNLLADLSGAPARFDFEDGQVRLRFDCETVAAPVELRAPGEVEVRWAAATRSRSGACSLNDAHRERVVSILSGAVTAENIPPDRLYLAAGDVYAVLRRD